jgi:hypothetical protein
VLPIILVRVTPPAIGDAVADDGEGSVFRGRPSLDGGKKEPDGISLTKKRIRKVYQ